MYALSFDMVISDLKQHYGEPYNNAYFEIKELLKKNGFDWVQGSTYMTENDDLAALVKTIMELSKVDWFKKSVRDLRGFKVESWSDFTTLVKNA
ncbi:putative virulence-associated protein D [Prevotella dentalis DSM 3688]|uniref:Endoribonuclease VapD n=1 Tax=Prevotella dentalis (strain ATCC 49559 / DSM 3688 / JCM 13448 / NCTC 12043 / ES 2772) TaxID=908937 RepID=F9D399_PREDD|nr:virulence protein [Prevotella dentalis]AGB28765.1 putative virulence-associated protein D [Prevotella dentalis DSM 3688]EGQ14650.1 virulence associated protein D [Prevotella dentalis DSM 3688]